SGTGGDHGVTFTLLDPRGSKLAEKRVLSSAGMATNDFDLAESLAGGVYTLRAVSDLGTTLDKTFVVSSYEPPRIKKSLEFSRKSYGPAEQVTAYVKLAQPTGEPVVLAKVSAVITIDGAELARFFVPLDNKGAGAVRFQLPAKMAKGDGLLTLAVDAG